MKTPKKQDRNGPLLWTKWSFPEQGAGNYEARIISLDEAFAGVDDNNIRDMFRILTKLDLEYIINSQVLWGEYDTIPSLAINELISDPSLQLVSVIRYKWDGNKRTLVV